MRHKLQPAFDLDFHSSDLDGPAVTAAVEPANVSGVHPAGPKPTNSRHKQDQNRFDAQNLETLSLANGNPRIHDAEIEW